MLNIVRENNFIVIKNKVNISFVFLNYYFLILILKKSIFLPFKNIFFFIYSVNYYYFKKFFYTGKSYKMYMSNKKIECTFNRDNITDLFFKNFISIKIKKKTKYFLKFLFYADIGFLVKYLKKIREFNIFTKRGIKINKIPFFKKKGKISQYRLIM